MDVLKFLSTLSSLPTPWTDRGEAVETSDATIHFHCREGLASCMPLGRIYGPERMEVLLVPLCVNALPQNQVNQLSPLLKSVGSKATVLATA